MAVCVVEGDQCEKNKAIVRIKQKIVRTGKKVCRSVHTAPNYMVPVSCKFKSNKNTTFDEKGKKSAIKHNKIKTKPKFTHTTDMGHRNKHLNDYNLYEP